MITLQNNTNGTYIHGEYVLKPSGVVEIPDKIANIWLKIDGIVEYKDPQEAKAEKDQLEKENLELKKRLKNLKNNSQLKRQNKC